MKFTMYKKETTDKKYHENPYRAVNFAKDADGNCPRDAFRICRLLGLQSDVMNLLDEQD